MPAHKHAELMALYAQDAAETDRPWERWEAQEVGSEDWSKCVGHPYWHNYFYYRRKPRTIRIGEFDVPEPLRAAPKRGTYYFVPTITNFSFPIRVVWADDEEDAILLGRGLVHLTQGAAESHARALLSLSKVKE